MSLSPAVILYDANGVAMAVENGVATPANTRALIVAGSDGTNSRFLKTAADGTLRVDPTGTTTQPVSAASLPLPSGAATEATLALIKAKTDNLDVALSDLTTPSDTQPVSAASLPLPTGAATETTLAAANTKLSDGTQKAIARGGAKGSTAAADVTSTSVDADTQALHVSVVNQAGSVSANQGTPNTAANGWPAKITDGTNIASVSAAGALKVDTGAAASLVGLVSTNLLNTGSAAMNVNGSVTPVVFSYGPDATDDVEILALTLIGEEGTINFGEIFIASAVVPTNGLLVEIKAENVVYTVAVIKRTRDMVMFGNAAFGMLIAGQDIIYARHTFPSNLLIKATGTYPGNEDYVRITVRDNLTGVDHLSAVVEGLKR